MRYRSLRWPHHVSKVVHAQAVCVFAHGVLQVVQLNLLQVLLPDHSPPALLFLQRANTVQAHSAQPGTAEASTVNTNTLNTLPGGIFYCASSSTDASVCPAVHPDWGQRALRSGTRPKNLEAAFSIPTGKQKTIQKVSAQFPEKHVDHT